MSVVGSTILAVGRHLSSLSGRLLKPLVILLGGLLVPIGTIYLSPPVAAEAQAAQPSASFWAGSASDVRYVTPLAAAAQIKRVAAARNLPYATVRRLVDDNTINGEKVDIPALNHALDELIDGK